MLRSNSKNLGNKKIGCSGNLKGFAEKEGFKPGMKE